MRRPPPHIAMILTVLLAGTLAWCTGAAIQHDRANQALIAAVWRNDTGGAIAALDAGANPNARDDGGLVASTSRRLRRRLDELRGEGVQPYDPQPTALLVLFEPVPRRSPENVALVQALLDRGADPNAREPRGWTVLLMAVVTGHDRGVRLLLDHGAWPDAVTPGGGFGTALGFASCSGQTNVVELLLAHRANVELSDSTGHTPLMWAAGSGHTLVARRLLQAGAHVNARACDGLTALMCAAGNGDSGTVRALLEARADRDARDADGNSALGWAARERHNDVVRLLKKAGAK